MPESIEDFIVSNALADYTRAIILAQLGVDAIVSFDGHEKFLEIGHLSFAFSDTYICIASYKNGVTGDDPFETQNITGVVAYVKSELNIK